MIEKVFRSFISICVLCFVGCGNDVETTLPQRTDIVESVYASGVLKSKNQYEVFSRSNGLVKAIFVREGDEIHKGEPLFRIENGSSPLQSKMLD